MKHTSLMVICLLVTQSEAVTAGDSVVVVSQMAVKDARQPQAAIDPDGNIYVAFGADHAIFCCRSSDGGRSFNEPTPIGTVDGLALGRRRGPRIVAGSKAAVVTAISHDTGNLSSWRSTDGGKTWAGPTQVNDAAKSAREGLHAMAISPEGDIFCTWLDLRSGQTDIFGSLSTDGGITWSDNQLVYRSPSGSVCECCHPSAAYDASANLHVMWRNSLDGDRDMYIAVSRDGGKTFGDASRLGTENWQLNACPMDGGWLASTRPEQITTVWRRENRVYRTDAARPGEQLLGTGMQPWVAGTSIGAYIVWVNQRRGVLRLSSPDQLRPTIVANNATDPVIVSPINGTHPVVAVWESGHDSDREIRSLVVSE